MMRRTYELAKAVRVIVQSSREPALYRSLLGPAIAAGGEQIELTLGDAGASRKAGGRYKGLRWSLGATEHDGSLAVHVAAPLFLPYLALHLALIPAAQHILRRSGMALIAGAAAQTPAGAMLLVGGTGAGKTSAMLRLVASGALPIGDEYVVVDKAGRVAPLFHGVALRRGARGAAPALYGRLPARDRRLLALFEMAARLTRGRLRPLLHTSWAALGLDQARDSVAIAAATWIDPDAAVATPATADDLARRVCRHMSAHAAAYGDPLRDLGVTSPEFDEGMIARALERVACRVAPPRVAEAPSAGGAAPVEARP